MVFVEIDVHDTEVIEDMKHNCSLISLSLGGNEVDEQVIEMIEHELASNRGIDAMILPMIKNKEKSQEKRKARQAVENWKQSRRNLNLELKRYFRYNCIGEN